jgi:hypothetical protein
MPKVCQLLSLVDLQPALLLVAAVVALASLVAEPPLGEALAVHFETVYFGALATGMGVLARREVHVRNGAQDVLVIGKLVGLLDELVEEILMGAESVGPLLELLFGDEFEGARGRGGVLGPDF